MVPWLPVALALVVVSVVLEGVSRLALRRYGEGLNSLPTVVLEEFPEIERSLLDKYTSFDSELGWSPQPNTTKQKDTGDHLPGEEVRSVVTYSTDEYGSRVCPAADRDSDSKSDIDSDTDSNSDSDSDSDSRGLVSTYGDSYCFCREVDDDETFQHYLAEELDAHVGNYGGGNYGLDQSLLRLKRRYPDDPTDYVFVVVTASSIARIRSVWKHYQEFGNVLAVKPRYELADDGSLELVDSPVDEKEDLLDLESRAEFLREHDYHYEHWFKSHLVTAPYAPEFFGNRDHVLYAINEALAELEDRYEITVPGIDIGKRRTETTMRLERERVRYHEELFDEKSELFSAIVGEFVDYADREDFTPVFVMVQQLRYATYERENGPIYGDLMDRLDERYDDLETIDMARHLSPENDDVESLYVQRGEGGHYSAETNAKIATVLADVVES